MRKKRILSLLMTLVLMTSFLPHAAAVSARNFTDVSEDSWYYEYVDFVADKGYFAGTSATTFSPDLTMTRAMFVTVLARVDDAEIDNSVSAFVDVPTDTWYTGSVTWASENGIVSGIGDNRFDPDGEITREQMCVIMDRFIDYYGEKTNQVHETEGSTALFPDNSQISSWARDAVANCREYGLIAGYDDGLFHPLDSSTRAQVATVISRLAWLVKPEENPNQGGGGGGGGGGGTTRYTYTLTYNANGGVFSDGQTTRQQTATSTSSSSYVFTIESVNPTRDGYRFLGWSASNSATTADYTAGSSYTVGSTRSGTLYAVWSETPVVGNYTITYYLNPPAGEDSVITTVDTNGAFTTLASATLDGYALASWNTAKDGTGTQYALGAQYTAASNLDLYAQWIADNDYIGLAVQATMEQFNQMLPMNSISVSSAAAALDPVSFSVATSDSNTRPQTVTASAEVSDDLIATIIEQAATMACSLMDNPPSQGEVDSVVNDIIDALEEALDITISGQTAQEIADQVYAKVLEVGKSLWTNFYDDDGNYYTGNVTVSVNDVSATINVDQDNHTTTLNGSKRTALVNLGTAFAKDLYEDLKGYSTYTGVVELDGTVTFTFTDGTAYGAATDEYPHVYPVTLNLTLDGGGLIEYKYVDGTVSPSYVKLNLTQDIQNAYSSAVDDVVETALDQPSVQNELRTAIENVMNGISGNSTFQTIISALEGIGVTEGDAQSAVTNAMTAWQEANLDVTDLTSSPIYQIYWLDQNVSYNNEAIYDLIDYVAENASEYAWNTIASSSDNEMTASFFSRVRPYNLRNILTNNDIDLNLDSYPDLEEYVLSKMSDLLRAEANRISPELGIELSDFASEAAPAMYTEVNGLLSDTLEESSYFQNYMDKALKLKSIESIEDVALSNLASLLENQTFLDFVGERGSSYVDRLTNLIGRLPAGASVTIGGEGGFTISEAALSELQNADTTSEACAAIANLINGSDYLKALSLSDFYGEDGQEITVQYNSRTFTFHLVIELQ